MAQFARVDELDEWMKTTEVLDEPVDEWMKTIDVLDEWMKTMDVVDELKDEWMCLRLRLVKAAGREEPQGENSEITDRWDAKTI